MKLPNYKAKVNVYAEKQCVYLEVVSDDLKMENAKMDITDVAIIAVIDSMEYQARETGYCALISGGRKIEFSKEGAE